MESNILLESSSMFRSTVKQLSDDIKHAVGARTDGDNVFQAVCKLRQGIADANDETNKDDVFQAFKDGDGLRALTDVMRKNSDDSVTAFGVLDMLTGPRYSNASLPVLEDGDSIRILVDLGCTGALLRALERPALPQSARVGACRMLSRLLSHSQAQEEALSFEATNLRACLDATKKANGVDVILHQIWQLGREVDAAAALAVWSKQQAVREQLRDIPHCLERVFHCYMDNLQSVQAQDDLVVFFMWPKLLLTVWSFEEVRERVRGIDGSWGALSVMEPLPTRIFQGRFDFWVGIGTPMLDTALDILSAVSYVNARQFEWFAMSAGGVAFSIVMSTLSEKTCSGRVLNMLTLGNFSVVTEVRVSDKVGFKTERLVTLHMYEAVEAAISLFVASYACLVSDYVDGYAAVGGWKLMCRLGSISFGLKSLAAKSFDFAKSRLAYSNMEFGKTYREHFKRYPVWFDWMLFLYTASEWCAWISVFVFQVAARPSRDFTGSHFVDVNKLPLLMLLGAQLCILCFVALIASHGRMEPEMLKQVLLSVFINTFGGKSFASQTLSRATAVTRLLILTVAWIVIAYETLLKDELEEHLFLVASSDREWTSTALCMTLVFIAAAGSAVHFACTLEQCRMGRWKFDLDLEELPSSDAGIAGLALGNWRTIHKGLQATARVTISDVQRVCKPPPLERQQLDEAEYTNQHLAFLKKLFDAALGLYLPKAHVSCGKHVLSYLWFINDEYHYGLPYPKDALKLTSDAMFFDGLDLLRSEIQGDWMACDRSCRTVASPLGDLAEACTFESFEQAMDKRHRAKLGGVKVADDAFQTFLRRIYEACVLLGGPHQVMLERHEFSYAALCAYEFYFADARSHPVMQFQPVTDCLGVTR